MRWLLTHFRVPVFFSGWTMNAWSRFARQKGERTSSALIAEQLPQGAAPEMIPMRKLLPVPHSQQRREGSAAMLALLCGFSSAPASASAPFGSASPLCGWISENRLGFVKLLPQLPTRPRLGTDSPTPLPEFRSAVSRPLPLAIAAQKYSLRLEGSQ